MLEPGALIAEKYRVVALLGEGGMGAVYEAENLRIRRRVAIKVLKPELSSDVESVSRFEREAQAAGRIGSDHILEILDLGQLPSGERFLVMEYLEGETLSARIQRLGRIPPHALLPILLQVLEALSATHDAGIIHRDLKPDNVFILREKAGKPDFVKLIDFGISKFQSQGLGMTQTGAVMGTPLYMSPEQAKGARDIDERADLYAVGLIAYEAICGRLPFEVETFAQLLMKIALEDPPHPRSFAPGVDEALSAIVLRALARDRDQRPASARELAAELERWAGAEVAPAPPPAPAPAPVAALPAVAAAPPARSALPLGLVAVGVGGAVLIGVGVAAALALTSAGTSEAPAALSADPTAPSATTATPPASTAEAPAAPSPEPADSSVEAAPSASAPGTKRRVVHGVRGKGAASAKSPPDFGY